MRRDVTLTECRRLLAQARIVTGSHYSLVRDADSDGWRLYALTPTGSGALFEVDMGAFTDAADALAFLQHFMAALEFSDEWRASHARH